LREFSFPISYFVGLAAFFINIMSNVISNFYIYNQIIYHYTYCCQERRCRNDKAKKNSHTDWNDNFCPQGANIYE